MIKLGQRVRDEITGFEGIAIARLEYQNGCIQYCVKPQMKPGAEKMPEGEYIDQGQLKVVKEEKHLKVKKQDNGGEMPDTPKANYSG